MNVETHICSKEQGTQESQWSHQEIHEKLLHTYVFLGGDIGP